MLWKGQYFNILFWVWGMVRASTNHGLGLGSDTGTVVRSRGACLHEPQTLRHPSIPPPKPVALHISIMPRHYPCRHTIALNAHHAAHIATRP